MSTKALSQSDVSILSHDPSSLGKEQKALQITSYFSAVLDFYDSKYIL